MNQRYITILGWVATFTAICMYTSYIPQILANLDGNKCTPIQPLAAVINCSLWVSYGLLKEKRDYPVALSSVPGIILGIITFITAL